MNNRIEKLAKRAGFVFWKNESYKPNGQIVDWSCDYDNSIEKFAESIINECAIIANRAENTETEVRCMYDVITEHFGVQ